MNKAEHLFLRQEIKRAPRCGVVVEVGSWTGGSAHTMLEAAKRAANPIKFYFVDPWCYGPGECAPVLTKKAEGRDIKAEFDERLSAFRGKYKTFQLDSVVASKYFVNDSVHLLFLDGDHTYEGVMSDLEAWYPKVKPGGVICGHDFGRPEYGVTQAVREFFDGTTPITNSHRSMWRVVKK